jgi:formate-dependent nitrite reductase cytochrome c552 subunit
MLTFRVLCLVMLGGVVACSPQGHFDHHDRTLVAAAEHFTTEPMRGETRVLQLHVDGDAFDCSMCHDGFSGDLQEEALEGAHANIQFDHGRNLRCLNCHNPENSDAFVSHDGSEIPGNEPTQLCAKCHGPHYRDWEYGVHGRVDGSWTNALGVEQRLDCIQCHDPHQPQFQPMAPAPSVPSTRFERDLRHAATDGVAHDESG